MIVPVQHAAPPDTAGQVPPTGTGSPVGEPLPEGPASARFALEEPTLPDAGQLLQALRHHRYLLLGLLLSVLAHVALFSIGIQPRSPLIPGSRPQLALPLQVDVRSQPERLPESTMIRARASTLILPLPPVQPERPAAPPARRPAAETVAFTAGLVSDIAPPATIAWWQFSSPDLGYLNRQEVDQEALTMDREALAEALATVEPEHVGFVRLRIYVGQTGLVERLEILASSPPGVFDPWVMREYYQQRFVPARKNGIFVKSVLETTVHFGPADAAAAEATPASVPDLGPRPVQPP